MDEEKIKEKIEIAKRLAEFAGGAYKEESFSIILKMLLSKSETAPDLVNKEVLSFYDSAKDSKETKNLTQKKKSLNERISELFTSEWASNPRSLREIKEELAKKGFHYPITTISARVIQLTRRGILRRLNSETGKFWVYVLAD